MRVPVFGATFSLAQRKLLRRPFTMFDSVTISEIPKHAVAVAGYVNGRYRTYPELHRAFPHARRLSIAVSADRDANCLDVEQGDAAPSEAVQWVKRQHARGVRRPVVYCSVSVAPTLLQLLREQGIQRKQIRLWTAHYTHQPHRCTQACGYGLAQPADATQWTDHYAGHNLDASLCAPSFL